MHASVAHTLGVAIVTGNYQPGDRLSGEIEFAGAHGVARSVYREALRMLAAKGLVESKPKTGTHVLPRARWNMLDPEVLAWMFEGEPSEQFIDDLFALRMIVEPAAAGLAAQHRSGRQLALMGNALAEMARYGLARPEGREADQTFHRALLEAAGNEPLASLSSTIAAAVGWTTIFKQRRRKLPRDPLPGHQLVYDAIADGDQAAAHAAMADLVAGALDDTRRR